MKLIKRLVSTVLLVGLAFLTQPLFAADVEQMHREMLYAVARVRSGKATGSGTVLYSAKDVAGSYRTYVITNYHVVEDLIEIKKQWNPVLKRTIDTEVLGKPTVELFQYVNLSMNVGITAMEAEIVAYDGAEDLALLRLRDTERPVKYVAKFFPPDKADDIHLYDEIWAAGAALGHPPIITQGHVAYQNDIIDNYQYWCGTALTIFGNSGGAVFRLGPRGYEFIGIPSRIAVMQSWGAGDAITHMGFFIPVPRVAAFLKRNFFHFIYDEKVTPEECAKLRDKQLSESLGRIVEEMRKP